MASLDTGSMLNTTQALVEEGVSVDNVPLPARDAAGTATQSTSHASTSPSRSGDTFERVEEYKAVLEEHSGLSARRQNLNDVFVAINSLFLTAIGFLIFQSKLDSWWFVGALGATTIAITPINLTWRTAIERYKSDIKTLVEYLISIEREFRWRREANESQLQAGELPIGFYLHNTVRRRPHAGLSRIEMRLATYFIILYPLITIVVAALTYLVTNGLVSTVGL